MRKQLHVRGGNLARRTALAGRRLSQVRHRTWRMAGAAALVVGLTAYAVTGAVAGPHHPPGSTATAGRLTVHQEGSQPGAGQPAGPPATAAPAGASLPGALAIAAPHSGAGWMQDDLMVRVPRWRPGQAGCTPAPHSLPDTRSAPAVPGACGAVPQLTTASPPGYGASQLRAYLHLTGTGAGQKVAIVDAFDNPYATSDITAYSRQFGLPVPCSTRAKKAGCFSFTAVHPFGFAGVDPGWAMESDLDVQMVHAIAPKASIILVEAYDNSTTSLLQAIDYAAALKPAPAVISNSYGGAENPGEALGDQHCDLARSLCVFATGDSGNPGGYPAYSPYVLSVGGTTLVLSPRGQVRLEAGWCCGLYLNSGFGIAGGGGVSQYESRPAYQDGVNPYQGRGIPDVSFDADPYTGVAVYDTFGLDGQNGWFEVGGTSAGAPAWSAIVAAADQLRAAARKTPLHGAGFQAQQLIYGMPHATGFGDVTRGVNNLEQCNAALSTPVQACQAHPGYDLVTGWGSPRPGIDNALASAP